MAEPSNDYVSLRHLHEPSSDLLRDIARLAFQAKDPQIVRYFESLGARDDPSRLELIDRILADPDQREELVRAFRMLGGAVYEGQFTGPDWLEQVHEFSRGALGMDPADPRAGPIAYLRPEELSHARVIEATQPAPLRFLGRPQDLAPIVLRHVGRDVDGTAFEPAFVLTDDPEVWRDTPRVAAFAGPRAPLYADPRDARRAAEEFALVESRTWHARDERPSWAGQPTAPVGDPRSPAADAERARDAPLLLRLTAQGGPDADPLDRRAAALFQPAPPRGGAHDLAVFTGFQAGEVRRDAVLDTARLPGAMPGVEMAHAQARHRAAQEAAHRDAGQHTLPAPAATALDAPAR